MELIVVGTGGMVGDGGQQNVRTQDLESVKSSNGSQALSECSDGQKISKSPCAVRRFSASDKLWYIEKWF